MDRERLEELIARHFAGALAPAEREELDAAMARDPEAARLLRRWADEELALAEALGAPPPAFAPPRRRRLPLRAAAAALVLLAAGTWLLRPAASPPLEYEGGALFALADDGPLRPAPAPRPGVRYLARSGLCRLGEARLAFEAPTVFRIPRIADRGRRQPIALEAGCTRVRTRGTPRLLIETAEGTLRDIGTDFEVELNEPIQEDEMIARIRARALPIFVTATVFSGSVAWESRAGETRVVTPADGPVKLSHDPALGVIGDRAGLVFIRPVLGARWTLAREGARIERGDWIKTGARGANAAELRLKDGAGMTLGPGGLVEVADLAMVRLHRGDLEVRPVEGVKVRVEGPGGAVREVGKPRVLRAREDRLDLLAEAPRWLTNYRAKASTEAMGSLLAEIDGRNEPLTLGYHKVTVDIRDQIARTIVEESFLNHTDSVLEGVFYFPLPQDASISGFGMWIGGEYVEADVVEKQRAREIYETILREKRDPGLLEWTGGNIFKARVYPIPRHGEKRIKITYTQVLPKEGRTYRYFYALRSEMLRLHPLRLLRIDVRISSAEPLARVACPSHMARVRMTGHAAQVEFEAEEYTPRRDLEVRVETKPSARDIVVIPHRRADEGYFMVLLSARGEEEGRGLVRDTAPLDLVIIADTSASMTDAQIREERAFIASLLESLGEKDRFNLLGFDVEAEWAFPSRLPVTAENREKALAFLERRGALGWTDLDLAFREAMARVRKETHVVYVGDGMITAGDADPVAFAKRLGRAYRGEGTFHAVGVGSSHDLTVLRAIASLGGGSLHRSGAGRDAAEMATALLEEITSPGMRAIRLAFDGVRVARVYPEILPNLPAGRQQVILGRFLPEDRDIEAKLRITAEVEGKPVTTEVPVTFPRAEGGNAFIPRLWARLHLDHLLAQGRDPAVVERIIALSEDYQIITPYTSFLVLESEADRERFEVKRRFRMRGGEEFFAEGRDRAAYELARRQMLAAMRWRRGIRDQILRLYEGMGQDLAPPRMQVERYTTYTSLRGARLGREVWKSYRDATLDAGRQGLVDYELVSGGTGLQFAELPAGEEVAMAPSLGTWVVGGYTRVLAGRAARPYRRYRPRPRPPFAGVFPVPGGPRRPFEGEWPDAIRQAIAPCNRRGVLAEIRGGLRIAVESDGIDHRGRKRPGERSTYLIGARAWASTSQVEPGAIPFLRFLHDGRRGILDLGRLLGSRRKAEEGDAGSYPAPFARYFDDLEAPFRGWIPSMERKGDRVLLKLVAESDPRRAFQVRIDARRGAILEVATLVDGKPVATETYGDFVEVAGASWPRRIEWRGEEGEVTRVARIAYEALDEGAFARAVREALAPLPKAIVLDLPLPKLADAKQRARDGKASFADRWVLVNHFGATQRWARVGEHFDAAAKRAKGKPGLRWIRLEVLKAARRNEEAKALAFAMARDLAAERTPGDLGLAQALYRGMADRLQWIERLALIEALRPAYARADERLFPRKEWERLRLAAFDALGRTEEAFALREKLAGTYPDDASLQIDYAHHLVGRGEVDRAVAHLVRAAKEDGPWTDGEVLSLRERAAGILYERRRLVDFLAYADAWLAEGPKAVSAGFFSRYLSALVMLDREAEADGLIETWLAEARGEEPDPVDRARFDAALAHALGEGADLHADRIEPKWRPVLAAVARAFARSERRGSIAGRLVQHHRFGRTDEGFALRRGFYRGMARDVATLPPAVLKNLYDWTRGYVPAPDAIPRDAVLQRILERWRKEADPRGRRLLAQIILRYGPREMKLALRRDQLERAKTDRERAEVIGALFDLLLSGPWSREAEDELLGLLPRIGLGEGKLAARADGIARIAQYLVRSRATARIEAIPDRNKKSRRALRPLEEEARRKAIEDVLRTLEHLEKAHLDPQLLPFVRIERLTLEARRRREPARVARDLEALIRAIPEPAPEEERAAMDARRAILAERALRVWGHVATRPDADPAIADGLLALLKEAEGKGTERFDARLHLYRLLVTLDRPEEIEALLERWAKEGGEIGGNRWRVPYGYILAEQGKLEQAVRVFEAVEKIDELGPAEYRALAGWTMALGRKAANREARIKVYEVLEEWRIRQGLRSDLRRYQRRGEGVPEELDEEVLLRFAALLRKSSNPGQHLWILRDFYEATKDFRLLESLPEAVIGQSAARIYPFLREARSVIGKIEDEATADRLRRHLKSLRAGAKTDVDRRALDLLEFLVERRAADQAHGAGPHVAAALEALRHAYKGEWAEGEPVLMASLLASVGNLVEPLRAEALRQLRALHDAAKPGTQARFRIADHRAAALWRNDRKEEAIRVLAAAIGAYREARGGHLPRSANDVLSRYVSRLEDVGEYAAAEHFWRDEIARGGRPDRLRWLALQLYEVHDHALAKGAATALGRGAELYRAVRDEILAALAERTDERHARALVERLCSIFGTAHRKGIPVVGRDLSRFAFGTLPKILALYQYRDGQRMVATVAETMRVILGDRDALAFLVTRAENEPRWLRRARQDFWSAHGQRVAEYRCRARSIEDLAPRLLAIVLEALRADLADRRARNRSIYWHSNSYYWQEKAGDFFRTATEVLEAHRDSEESVKYIARYLFHGLGRRDAAIDALFAYHRKHGLGRDGRWRLVDFLHRRSRFAESIPLLVDMIEVWPDPIDYRVALMRAYFHTGEGEKLEAVRAAADAYFHEKGRWTESVIAKLAGACLETRCFEASAAYYEEAIALRRKRPGRRGSDGTLSSYYGSQARAYAGLGRTKEAVDAAAGAIVCWGRNQENRKKAEESLLQVLRGAKDLDAYAKAFEAEVERTRQEKPIVRKALGRVFLDRERYADAIRHLEAAVESGPPDAETHRLLIEAYEKAGDRAGAAERLLALARSRGHDLALYEELAGRYEALERRAEAERARATLAEISAEESEGHAMLARLLAKRGRHAEAALQWRHVVRIRSKEPAGYLGLADALLAVGEKAEAREVLEGVLARSWPTRFGDVKAKARERLARIPRDR